MSIINLIDGRLHALLNRRGYLLMRKSNPNYYLGRRMKLMRSYGIDMVLDVGANTGQYAIRLREMGYTGEIVSFEPMRSAYERLVSNSNHDHLWSCRDFALGDSESDVEIHVSGNSVSSSILPMLPEHEKHAPASHVINDEAIHVKRMDTLPDWSQWRAKKATWLKIDVQGYERQVLDGASGCIADIAAIQLELSLRPLYAQQLTIIPMMERLAELGFDPVAFEPGFSDKESGEFLQVDGIFRNRRMR
ncbi:FkbM family methyltransferase [Stenotrophomonas sp. NLF4-10]|uniref:FkbM family methyltransferase n=1 Tax=Stenotrophomonas sp. NLF4-10 TaxID=2918754 RepID=UPI001EFBD3BC|nr:FkbM family methyltransferase [Stenotrophomonas sp. NLF4-10]MCG8277392.1 FkbM family methyltransferase [Stenotrophomonas sp. NLF4-10]